MIPNVIFQQQDLLHLQEKDQYDFIYCIVTLIYFSKKDTTHIIKNLTSALKKDGYLYLDLPQKDFSKITFFPEHFYKKQLELLKKENNGDLYSFKEIIQLLIEQGYEITYFSKPFSFFGKFAWEVDKILQEKNIGRLRYIFVPFLKLCARIDAITKHKKGSCFVVLVRKTE